MANRDNMTFVQMASRIELQQLQYFVTVAEHLNFSKAAERLFVTQPLLSQQISALESTLGVQLFQRNTKTVSLTSAGAVLLVQARRILAKTEDAFRAARQADCSASQGRLRILCDFVFEKEILTEGLTRYREEQPGVECDIRILPYPTILSVLDSDGADAGFLMVPEGESLPPELCWQVLERDVLELVTGRSAFRGTDLESLLTAPLPLLLFECDSRLLNLVQHCCRILHMTPQILFFQTLEDMMVNVELGEGITILPQRMAEHYRYRPLNRISLAPWGVTELRYMACWRERRSGNRAADMIRALWGQEETVL